MATFTLHAGDFRMASFSTGFFGGSPMFSLVAKGGSIWSPEEVPVSELEELEVSNRDQKRKSSGKVVGALVGGALAGPVGLLAGAVLASPERHQESVTFTAKFRDGRRMLASTDPKTFLAMQAAKFDCQELRLKFEQLEEDPVENPWMPEYLKNAPEVAVPPAEAISLKPQTLRRAIGSPSPSEPKTFGKRIKS